MLQDQRLLTGVILGRFQASQMKLRVHVAIASTLEAIPICAFNVPILSETLPVGGPCPHESRKNQQVMVTLSYG